MPVSPTLSSILAGFQGQAEGLRLHQNRQGSSVSTNPFFDSFANVRNRLSGRGNRPTGGPSGSTGPQVNRTSTVELLGESGIIPQYHSSFPGPFTGTRGNVPGPDFNVPTPERLGDRGTIPQFTTYQRPDDMTQFFVDITTGTYDPLTFSQHYEFFRKQVEAIPLENDQGERNEARANAEARLQQLVDAHNTQLSGQASEADAQRRGQALQQAYPDLFGGFDPTVLGNTADNVIAQMIAGAQQRLQSTQDGNQRLQLEQEIARLEQARQQVAFDRVSAARAPFLQNNLFQELFPGFTNAQQLGGLGQSAFGAILQNLFQTRQSRQQRNRFTEALGALPFFQSFSPQQLQGVTPEMALFLLQREEHT